LQFKFTNPTILITSTEKERERERERDRKRKREREDDRKREFHCLEASSAVSPFHFRKFPLTINQRLEGKGEREERERERERGSCATKRRFAFPPMRATARAESKFAARATATLINGTASAVYEAEGGSINAGRIVNEISPVSAGPRGGI